MPKLDTCDCGSTQFEEYRVPLDLNFLKSMQWGGSTVHKGEVKQKDVWVRFCGVCSKVTFWSKPSRNTA